MSMPGNKPRCVAVLWILCCLSAVALAQGDFTVGDAIYVDFGASSTTTPGNWNNMTSAYGTIEDAITAGGVTTAVDFALPDRFNGVNENGTTEPDAALGLPAEATRDSFYGNDAEWGGLIEPTAQLVISDLDPSLSYELTFFCSRMGVSDVRQTQYDISGLDGLQQTVYLDPANNVDTQVVSKAIRPAESGEITIDIQKGPENNNGYGFYYLGALVLRVAQNLGATQPQPASGADDVATDVILEWTPGVFAAAHDVYLGKDLDAVSNASVDDPMGVLVGAGQADSAYAPEMPLEFGQVYYWRVDEVNAAPDYTVFPGEVWTFEVEPYSYPLTPIAATASSQAAETMGPGKTIDGSGLDDLDQHGTAATDMWFSSPSDPNVWIEYEFETAVKLDQMWVWNSNQSLEVILFGLGARDVTVATSVNGTTWTALEDVPEFAQASGLETYICNTFVDFKGVTAKFVRLAIGASWSGGRPVGLSEVRFLYIPTKARGPQPEDGQTDVAVDTMLTWRAGRAAAAHEVYLDTDEQAVADGTALVDTVTEARYTPDDLAFGTTYYWKINGVNDLDPTGPWEGDVWSFSTQGYAVVEDFESYTDDSPNRVFQSWIDGYGFSPDEYFPNGNPGNGTGMGAGHDIWTQGTPYTDIMETGIVAGGAQSMPLYYDNTSATYSEAVYTFDSAQDWTAHGIKSLSIWFAGTAGNSGQLYVKINNAKVPYNGDATDIAMPIWQVWNIDLSKVSTDLSNVTKLTIGVEESGTAGLLYIDDIRLYPRTPEYITPVEPGTAGLVASYAFDGNANDSSGHGFNGTVNGTPTYGPGMYGQAIQLDGITDYVVVGSVGISGAAPRTICGWVKPDTLTIPDWTNIFGFTSAAGANSLSFDMNRRGSQNQYCIHVYGWERNIMEIDLEWHHLAATYDGTTIAWYGDGLFVGSEAWDLDTEDNVQMGKRANNDAYFPGSVDEVRIYDSALTDGEVAYLAGKQMPMHVPF